MHHTATAPGECSDLYRWTRVRFPAPPQSEGPPRLWGSFIFVRGLHGGNRRGAGRRSATAPGTSRRRGPHAWRFSVLRMSGGLAGIRGYRGVKGTPGRYRQADYLSRVSSSLPPCGLAKRATSLPPCGLAKRATTRSAAATTRAGSPPTAPLTPRRDPRVRIPHIVLGVVWTADVHADGSRGLPAPRAGQEEGERASRTEHLACWAMAEAFDPARWNAASLMDSHTVRPRLPIAMRSAW